MICLSFFNTLTLILGSLIFSPNDLFWIDLNLNLSIASDALDTNSLIKISLLEYSECIINFSNCFVSV